LPLQNAGVDVLLPGDQVPSFHVQGLKNPRFAFDTVAGRYVVLSFVGSSTAPGVKDLYRQFYTLPGPFDDQFASAFLVSNDLADLGNAAFTERYPGLRVFIDHDLAMARMFGCATPSPEGGDRLTLASWILDAGLRVVKVVPMRDPSRHFAEVCRELKDLPPPVDDSMTAPALIVPRVLEPEFCRELIGYFERTGSEDSGFMRTDPQSGKTQLVVDYGHKRRSDCAIEDPALREGLKARITRRLIPAIQRAFQFEVTRIERYLIACYDADSSDHFRPHKDNTTLGTAHRRFAVTIGLNAGEYEGGDLRFPEFGQRIYRAPTGGAVVFSCSILHEALPVTKGRRLVIVPFLYDEAASKLRIKNAGAIEDETLRRSVIQTERNLQMAKTRKPDKSRRRGRA
jgi:predicted 2-oxoglutarate/Fe(II)-dependent dioxygenase YbiX/peroxiredoxin